MNNYKYIIKDIQGNILFKSSSMFIKTSSALNTGNRFLKHYKEHYPIGSSVDVVPVKIGEWKQDS